MKKIKTEVEIEEYLEYQDRIYERNLTHVLDGDNKEIKFIVNWYVVDLDSKFKEHHQLSIKESEKLENIYQERFSTLSI